MRGIKELDQGSSDDASNSEAIGASTAEEINPKSTDRAPAQKAESAGQEGAQEVNSKGSQNYSCHRRVDQSADITLK